MERIDELLAMLPPESRAKIAEARAAVEAGDWRAVEEATDAATLAVGFPRMEEARPLFLRAGELSAQQRAIAELVALCELIVVDTALPNSATVIRRWLGLDPPTMLEREVDVDGRREPLWYVLQRIDDPSEHLAWLERFPVSARLEALVDLTRNGSFYFLDPDTKLVWASELVKRLGPGGADWARGVLAHERKPRDAFQRQLAFLALVRDQAPIDPAWDGDLPFGKGVPLELSLESARVLPDDRRDAAWIARLRPGSLADALAVLDAVDSDALARFVVEKAKKGSSKDRAKLREHLGGLAEKRPSLAALLAELPPPATPRTELGSLRLANHRKPFHRPKSELTEPQRLQLEALIASDMDSEGTSLDDFFGDLSEEGFPLKALEQIDVVDTTSGAVVADLFLYPFGNGAVVHHGTTKMIANIVQHGVTPHASTSSEWMREFEAAWRLGARELGVDDPGHFSVDLG